MNPYQQGNQQQGNQQGNRGYQQQGGYNPNYHQRGGYNQGYYQQQGGYYPQGGYDPYGYQNAPYGGNPYYGGRPQQPQQQQQSFAFNPRAQEFVPPPGLIPGNVTPVASVPLPHQMPKGNTPGVIPMPAGANAAAAAAGGSGNTGAPRTSSPAAPAKTTTATTAAPVTQIKNPAPLKISMKQPAKTTTTTESKPAEAEAKKPAEAEANKTEAKPAEAKKTATAAPAPAVSEEKKESPKKSETASTPSSEASSTATTSTEKFDSASAAASSSALAEEIIEDEEQEEVMHVETVEGKEHMSICFIGHVDAGKSTIGGHLLVLTDQVDKRTFEKFSKEAKDLNRESWVFSFALDTDPAEREKGKTHDVGRSWFETPKKRYTLLDAPGHKGLVPNMISGAAQADVAVLVISARKGEFEAGFDKGGQTREHAMLVKTTGVRKLVVVINKMDDSTVNWSQERYDEILGKLKLYLKQCGYNLSKDVYFMPISGFTGANLKVRAGTELCPWYDGPSLLEFLDEIPAIPRAITAPLRMPISEKFRDMGTLVCGKIESGAIKVGHKVLVRPNNSKCEIVQIWVDEEEKNVAFSGDNVRLKLKGVEEEDISMGFVLSSIKNPCNVTRSFLCQLVILEHKNIICAGFNSVLHIHTANEEVVLKDLLHLVDKKTGKKSKTPPKFVKPGQVCIAEIEAEKMLCLESYETFPQLGRFTLRDEGKTVAMGKVIKVLK